MDKSQANVNTKVQALQLENNNPLLVVLDATSNKQIGEMLKCPSCHDNMMAPIMQCGNGHLICSDCSKKRKVCPICRIKLANIRNLAMDAVAPHLVLPCKFNSNGCTQAMPNSERPMHEKQCDFRPYRCPYETNCTWLGSLSEVRQHLVNVHTINVSKGEKLIFVATDANLERDHNWKLMQVCHGRLFLFSIEHVNSKGKCQQLVVQCRLVGSPSDAAKFLYSISLESNEHSIKWQSSPISIREINPNATNGDFLVLNMETMKFFIHQNSLLINVAIKKVETVEVQDVN